jgi:hypothetical protein
MYSRIGPLELALFAFLPMPCWAFLVGWSVGESQV